MTDKEMLTYISNIRREVERATTFGTKRQEEIIIMLERLHEHVYYQQKEAKDYIASIEKQTENNN
jgi:hypothetical protein